LKFFRKIGVINRS